MADKESDEEAVSGGSEKTWSKKTHEKYLLHMLNVLPWPYVSQDSTRMTLIYFVIGSLDVLGKIDRVKKQEVIDYIYSLQIHPDHDHPENAGFRGSPFIGQPYNPECTPTKSFANDQPHVTMTFTALMTLLMVGDDLSRVNRSAIIQALPYLQRADGSLSPVPGKFESDMRFIYCACVVSFILGDWSGINKDRVISYIRASQSYDYGIGQGPGQESHGGSTYCAVASLHLMDRMEDLPNKEGLIHWCVERQQTGFQGRVNKPADTCYSFWIGATLTMLGAYPLVDYDYIRSFTLTTAAKMGGFGKWENTYPDVLHTYMGFAGMSLGGEARLLPIDCRLNVTQRAAGKYYVPLHQHERALLAVEKSQQHE